MKKTFSRLLAVMLLVSTICVTGASAADSSTPSVRVNDLLVNFPDKQPFIDSNNRTLIPVRFVTEALGASVSWSDNTNTATITLDGTTVKVQIGNKVLTVLKNGSTSTVTMDTQAVISSDRTCVPIRFVAEAFGAYVGFSNYYNTVEVCKEKLTKSEIERLRAYGYVLYPGQRYNKNADGTLYVRQDADKLFYPNKAASASFLDSNYGYDNAREFLLRHKYNTTYAAVGNQTGVTWKICDDNQARLFMNEAVALVNKKWTCDGLTASFITDTSCMYQDDITDGRNYSCRGILKLTVTNQNSTEMKTQLNYLGITFVSGQSEYTLDFEAKVYNLINSAVTLDRCYNLATCFG